MRNLNIITNTRRAVSKSRSSERTNLSFYVMSTLKCSFRKSLEKDSLVVFFFVKIILWNSPCLKIYTLSKTQTNVCYFWLNDLNITMVNESTVFKNKDKKINHSIILMINIKTVMYINELWQIHSKESYINIKNYVLKIDIRTMLKGKKHY